jgi:pimeloyl-ACP methyl ester carboxylesterase/DNA-binding CsgD family transcriptional regulator
MSPVDLDYIEELVRRVAEGTGNFNDLIVLLLPHIEGTEPLPQELALRLATVLIDIERTSAKEDQLYGLVNEASSPSVALNELGQIIAINPQALETFHIRSGDGLTALGITDKEFGAFKERLSEFGGYTLINVRSTEPGYRPESKASHDLFFGIFVPKFRAFVLTSLAFQWTESLSRAFKDVYHLSSSEVDILCSLALGQTSETIAEQRNRSVGTVRQQIKGLLQKLKVSHQLTAGVVASTAAALQLTISPDQSIRTGTRSNPNKPFTVSRASNVLHSTGFFSPQKGIEQKPLKISMFYRNHRQIGWRHFGILGGTPILMLHGPSFGAGDYPHDRFFAHRYKLSVFALERPGYGRTDSITNTDHILEEQCLDILELLDQQGLEKVSILAHEVGLIPALCFANRYPHRVTRILGISAAPPFLEADQIKIIPRHQKIYIQVARHTPWLAHLFIRLLTVQMRSLGPQDWTKVIFQGLEPDTQIMSKPELISGIIGTYSFYLNQMGMGFEQDLQIMNQDWSYSLKHLDVPLTLLHGAKNLTTPPDHLDIFRRLNPGISIEIVPGSGLTLAITHAQQIYKLMST